MSEKQEIKAFVKAVLGGYVAADNFGYCKSCGQWRDLRMGCCFDCVFQECPLEICSYKKVVYNVKRERVLSDSKYIDRKTGKQYCDRSEGMCEEALKKCLQSSNKSGEENE